MTVNMNCKINVGLYLIDKRTDVRAASAVSGTAAPVRLVRVLAAVLSSLTMTTSVSSPLASC